MPCCHPLWGCKLPDASGFLYAWANGSSSPRAVLQISIASVGCWKPKHRELRNGHREGVEGIWVEHRQCPRQLLTGNLPPSVLGPNHHFTMPPCLAFPRSPLKIHENLTSTCLLQYASMSERDASVKPQARFSKSLLSYPLLIIFASLPAPIEISFEGCSQSCKNDFPLTS